MGKSWKNPKKAEVASKRGAIFSKLVKEIVVASKLGGMDPGANPRLRMAVDAAKAVSCPKDTIERAIKKGGGLLDDGKMVEELTYEGYAPHQVGVIIECQTDNRARTAPDLKSLFNKAGGNFGETGSVAWMFDRVGLIEAVKPEAVDDAEEAAINAGASDVEMEEQNCFFYTEPEELDQVRKELVKMGFEPLVCELSYRSKNRTVVTEEQKQEVLDFLEKLDDHDDTHRIHCTLGE